jgi:hypothetical protein
MILHSGDEGDLNEAIQPAIIRYIINSKKINSNIITALLLRITLQIMIISIIAILKIISKL